ncbi:MAG TPA: oligosaccharide flippase family protein, partial [Dongiaceae bacterium]|nr:oligosaccharide flippase family protein [Dongiaceae bacterium]
MTRTTASRRIPFGPELLLTLGRSAGFALTFFIPVVLTRVFDKATFGTYKQLFLVFGTMYFIAQGGMAESLFYFVTKAGGRRGAYVANAAIGLGALGFASGALVWAGAPAIAAWLNNPALAAYLPWVGAFLLLMLVSASLEIVLIARARFAWAAATYGVSDLARAALFIIPALITRRLEWVLAGAVAFAALRVVVTLGYFVREFKGALRPGQGALREQIAYALPFGVAVLVEAIQGNLHQYVVSARFDAATFAIYAVGCLQIPFVDFVAGPAGNVMMVRMSERIAEPDRRSILALWHQTTVRLALTFFPLTALLLVLGRDLILVLFTPAYAASVPIFLAWSLSILFPVLQTDGVLRVFARTRVLLLVNIARLLLIAGSISWFLSTFGLMGAVLVTLAKMLLAKILMLFEMKRLLGVGFGGLLPW